MRLFDTFSRYVNHRYHIICKLKLSRSHSQQIAAEYLKKMVVDYYNNPNDRITAEIIRKNWSRLIAISPSRHSKYYNSAIASLSEMRSVTKQIVNYEN